MSGLDGASALVVGGASRMGAATALPLAERGARVVVADLDEGRGQAVAAKTGGRSSVLPSRLRQT